jgi:hypothetical protein
MEEVPVQKTKFKKYTRHEIIGIITAILIVVLVDLYIIVTQLSVMDSPPGGNPIFFLGSPIIAIIIIAMAIFKKSIKKILVVSVGFSVALVIADELEYRATMDAIRHGSYNRDAVRNDLANLSSHSQQYYLRSTSRGGGGNDFKGYRLPSRLVSNDNGQYAIDDDSLGAVSRTVGSTDSIAVSTQEIWIVGIGEETGRDEQNPVKAIIKVTPTNTTAYVVN